MKGSTALGLAIGAAKAQAPAQSAQAQDDFGQRPRSCCRARIADAGDQDFIVYAQRHPGVVFLRKDESARFALASPLTIREDRG
jgi:hypothetical protein